MKADRIKIFLVGVVLVMFLQVTMEPFYHWCKGVYADAVQIMDMLRNRTDKFSWLDTQIFGINQPKAEEHNSGMMERSLPE